MKAKPIHWRLPTSKPKMRSAMTAISTTPPERTTWTTDSGASAMRGDVQGPGAAAHDHPDGEPREEYRAWPSQRWRTSTGRGLASTAVLEEEAQVRSDGAQKRQQDAELESHAGFIGPVRVKWSCRPITPSSAPPQAFLINRRAGQASGRSSTMRNNQKPLLFVDIDGVSRSSAFNPIGVHTACG